MAAEMAMPSADPRDEAIFFSPAAEPAWYAGTLDIAASVQGVA